MADVVTDVSAGAEMSDEPVQVVDSRPVILERRLSGEVRHLLVALRVAHVAEQPLCCSVWVVVLKEA